MTIPMDIRWLGIDIGAKPGGYRVLTSVQQIADMLLHWPPDKMDGAWEAAGEACVKALDTRTNAEAARAAFIMAAKSAGIHVNDDADRFDPPKREKPKKR